MTPAVHSTVRASMPVTDLHTAVIDTVDAAVRQHLDPQVLQRPRRGDGEGFREGRQDAWPRLYQHDARGRRIGGSELVAQALPRQFGDRSRQLDTGWPATDATRP
jgi:hypothetical protein